MHAADALGEKQDEIIGELAVAEVGGAEPGGVEVGDPGEAESDGEAGEGKSGVDVPHEDEVGREREEHVDALEDDAIDEQPGVLDVAGDAIEDGTGAVDVEEAKAKTLDFGVKAVAEFGHDFTLSESRRDHVVTGR